MFRSKRNFSILGSPGDKRATTNQPQASSMLNGQSPPCNKRMRLSSTLRTSSTLTETRAESIERSPILRGNNENNGLTLAERFTKATSLMTFQSNSPGLSGFVAGNNMQVVMNGEQVNETGGSAFELAPSNNCQISELVKEKEKIGSAALEKVETPPPSPIVTKLESRVDSLNREISQIRVELNELDVQIEAKFLTITTTQQESIKLKYKNLVVEDLFNVANGSLTEVRDLLNQIYNPAQDLEKKLRLLMEDSHRRHANKLEKVNFELNNLLETSEEAVRNKAKQFEHEISLQERVLITIECQKRHELSKERDIIEMEVDNRSEKEEEKNDEVNAKVADKCEQETTTEVRVDEDSIDGHDDECVIIDENQENGPESNTVEVGNSVRTPEPQATDGSGRDNDSATTIPVLDEEETDIEESKTDDDEDRCFTPCQAQRPK